MIPNVLKNFTLSVNGRGKAGIVDEVTPPKLTLKTAEHQSGGMDAPVDIELGMEKMTSNFTLGSYDEDTLALFGIVDGAHTPLTFKGALKGDAGKITPMEVSMRGLITEVDSGTVKMADKTQVKYSVSLRYYKLILGGKVIHEIDVEGVKRIINGVDQLEAERLALGL